jgi:hypothetical protein
MKPPILSLVIALLIHVPAAAQGDTNGTHRISVAEVETVRLEVEQPSLKNEFQLRVRDFAARNHQKATVTCDIYYVRGDGTETKVTTSTLRQVSPTADDYRGAISTEHTFTHGTIAKVVYRSPAFRLPISTWYAFYYH